MRFESDGQNVRISCTPSPDTGTEPVSFLSQFEVVVPGPAFERAVDQFINIVIARLDTLETDLQSVWAFVREERADEGMARERRLEAQIGFDAGESPEGVLAEFSMIAARVGADATAEVAPISAGSNPVSILKSIEAIAQDAGIEARPHVPKLESLPTTAAPWERGWAVARHWRSLLGSNGAPLDDNVLAGLLAISEHCLHSKLASASPLALAVRKSPTQSWLHFRSRNPVGRRFEAARFLAEHVFAPGGDSWLPITDARTARQKVQRAFAAEFLCPSESLTEFLAGNFSSSSIEAAADHFQVSELVVQRQLINHHLLPPGTTGDD